MKIETTTLTGAATLTSYILDGSPEFPNVTNRPAILVLPGGGYHMCSDREAEPVALKYAAAGYHAFVLCYAVGTDHSWPDPLNDADAAMKYIIENAAAFSLDTSRIAAIGFSAGGHLTAALGTLGAVKPAAIILGYPCILEEISNICAFQLPSLDECVDGTTPPTFLFSTADDTAVPIRNSLRFITALDNANIPFECHIFKSGPHGISLAEDSTNTDNPDIAAWHSMSVRFLQSLWGKL